jgi:hypothetical protein
MSENIQQKIESLREELHQHNYNYYILDEPTISDFEFDAKLKELQELETAHPEFLMPILLLCVLVVELQRISLPFSINSECILWTILMILTTLKTGKNESSKPLMNL